MIGTLTKYTTSLEEIIEEIWDEGHSSDSSNSVSYKDFYKEIDQKIEYAIPTIFGFDYPCYGTEADRIALEKHILNDYYTRNICCTSVKRWMLFLKGRMDDIMPRYKALYDAQVKLLASDYLNPYHISESKDTEANKSNDRTTDSKTVSTSASENESNSSNASTNEGNDNTTSKDITKFSNTPQALSDAVESGESIPLNYLSTMQTVESKNDNTYDSKTESSDTSKSNQSSNDNSQYNGTDSSNESRIEEIIREAKGNLSKDSNGKLIKEYQDVILNIEKLISADLSDLFYSIY